MINHRQRLPVFASEMFRTITTASPGGVWAALTATGSPPGYLYGLTAESDWRPGATLGMTLDRWRLAGEILAADRPRRLCYTLGGPPRGTVGLRHLGAAPP